MKLSIKLSLPQHGADTNTLLSRARQWLQSPALSTMLQQHGLNTANGSPGHLVTLMSALEVESSITVDAATPSSGSSSTSAAHHTAQHELGVAYWRNRAQPVAAPPEPAGTRPWGHLQQQQQPLVLDHPQGSAALSTTQHAHRAGGAQADEQDEVAKQTVLGAIVGAVLGSAAVGAGLAMAVVVAVRRKRTKQAGPPGCSIACEDGSDRHGRVSSACVSGHHRCQPCPQHPQQPCTL
jgi:hypothetical protein